MIIQGDSLTVLRTLPDQSVHCCVTSPPYWGLRDYGTATWEGGNSECDHKIPSNEFDPKRSGHPLDSSHILRFNRTHCHKCGAVRIDNQIGLESTPDEYVTRMVEVFREVRRVLRDDGTCWVNLGDSFASGKGTCYNPGGGETSIEQDKERYQLDRGNKSTLAAVGLKPKDLVGIPWSVAKALQAPFYTGRIPSEMDRVWLAATIDAEGSICGFHHTRKNDGSVRTGVHLTITNTNKAMLDNAYRIWPTSKQDHNRHGRGHLGAMDCWRWIAHDVNEKEMLLRELYPYLLCKRKQALLAWNFLKLSQDAKRLGHSCEASATKEKRSWIVHSLTRLNHLEIVDIPDWITEPPSLTEQGWWLRSDIIWSKPNPMPESVTDRPTKAHEYIFLLSKSARYYYDAEAVKELSIDRESINGRRTRGSHAAQKCLHAGDEHFRTRSGLDGDTLTGKQYLFRNRRSVWTVATQPYSEAHFATFPPKLIEPCILAGCPVGGTVLDPFCGSGTTGMVAQRHSRNFIGIELNPEYVAMAERRIREDMPLFAAEATS